MPEVIAVDVMLPVRDDRQLRDPPFPPELGRTADLPPSDPLAYRSAGNPVQLSEILRRQQRSLCGKNRECLLNRKQEGSVFLTPASPSVIEDLRRDERKGDLGLPHSDLILPPGLCKLHKPAG